MLIGQHTFMCFSVACMSCFVDMTQNMLNLDRGSVWQTTALAAVAVLCCIGMLRIDRAFTFRCPLGMVDDCLTRFRVLY